MQRSNHQDAKLHPLECKVTPIMVQSYILWSAKLHLSECKVTPIMVQSCILWSAKLHLSEYKVTPIMVQSNNYQNVIPIFFGFNLAYLPTTNAPPYTRKLSPQNCIIIQFECIFMQFWAYSPPPFVKIMPLFLVFLAL